MGNTEVTDKTIETMTPAQLRMALRVLMGVNEANVKVAVTIAIENLPSV